jgi:peptidoglycan/LPS O-acetylase OafA/YrhL
LWSLTGFQAFDGWWGGPFDSTSWFIGLIMTLYLVYPMLSKAVRRWPHITIILALLVTVFSRYMVNRWDFLPGGHEGQPLKWFPPCQLFWFVLGIYLVRVLKPDFWLCINRVGRIAPFLAFFSEISFPLFLVHFPLLSIITYHDRWGMSRLMAIAVWLVVSILISWLILVITNKYVGRKRISRRLFKRKPKRKPQAAV